MTMPWPGSLSLRVLALAALGCLSACATIEREDVAAPVDGGSVAMRARTGLVVSLPPAPTRDAVWVLRSTTPNLVQVGIPDVTPPAKPPGLVAVADTTTFRFRALEAGTGTLEFAATPAGNPAGAPERVIRYDVTIGPSLWVATGYFGTMGLERQPRTLPAEVAPVPATPSGAPVQGTVK